jgi:hypothetical protein
LGSLATGRGKLEVQPCPQCPPDHPDAEIIFTSNEALSIAARWPENC